MSKAFDKSPLPCYTTGSYVDFFCHWCGSLFGNNRVLQVPILREQVSEGLFICGKDAENLKSTLPRLLTAQRFNLKIKKIINII
jgi:hypothetical protein